MAYIIIKSAGDEFSFTTEFVPGEVGHSYAYAGALAARVTAAMRKAVEQSVHPTVCQCGEDCIPMLGEDTCVRCDLPLAHSG